MVSRFIMCVGGKGGFLVEKTSVKETSLSFSTELASKHTRHKATIAKRPFTRHAGTAGGFLGSWWTVTWSGHLSCHRMNNFSKTFEHVCLKRQVAWLTKALSCFGSSCLVLAAKRRLELWAGSELPVMDPTQMPQMGMGNPMQKGGGFYGGYPNYQANTWGFKGAKGKGKGRGKGKGKSYFSDDDPRRQSLMAQRQAQQRDRAAIISAQKSAQQRFEKDLLDRVQGKWKDEEDPTISYHVEGSVCSVSGQSTRTFRNRLSIYGGELCWDAKRFWHNLNFNALPPSGGRGGTCWVESWTGLSSHQADYLDPLYWRRGGCGWRWQWCSARRGSRGRGSGCGAGSLDGEMSLLHSFAKLRSLPFSSKHQKLWQLWHLAGLLRGGKVQFGSWSRKGKNMKQAADAESYFHLHSNSHPQLHPRIILKEEYGSHDVMDLRPHGHCSLVQGPCAPCKQTRKRAKKRIDKEWEI